MSFVLRIKKAAGLLREIIQTVLRLEVFAATVVKLRVHLVGG